MTEIIVVDDVIMLCVCLEPVVEFAIDGSWHETIQATPSTLALLFGPPH
jgi:hypothetical protein